VIRHVSKLAGSANGDRFGLGVRARSKYEMTLAVCPIINRCYCLPASLLVVLVILHGLVYAVMHRMAGLDGLLILPGDVLLGDFMGCKAISRKPYIYEHAK
jgi:hypothetical protein